MKALLYKGLLLAFCWGLAGWHLPAGAQTTPPNIIAAEYFINTDPGPGQATAVSLTAGQSIRKDFTVPVPTDMQGVNLLYVRVKDAAGQWSFGSRTLFYVEKPGNNHTTTPPNITAAEFFIDTDPGVGMANAITLPEGQAVSPSYSFTLPGTLQGTHLLFVRVKDASGRWSISSRTLFFVEKPGDGTNTPPPNITAAEYFLNTDPGVGQATAITLSANQAVNKNLSIILPPEIKGVQQLYVRVKDASRRWSLSRKAIFYIEPAADVPALPKNITAAEYFVDNDPGVGQGSAITITPGQQLNFSGGLVIDKPACLEVGDHLLYIRVRDADGKWSIVRQETFKIIQASPPEPAFTVADVCAGTASEFIDASTNVLAGAVYDWDFDNDGIIDLTSKKGNATYTYAAAGTYTAKLIITNGCDAKASITQQVKVNPGMSVNNGQLLPVCEENTLTLGTGVTGGSGNYTSYVWEGDVQYLSSATVANPVFQVAPVGRYEFTYTVTDNTGCSASGAVSVEVQPVPVKPVASSNSPLLIGETLQLSTDAVEGVSYYWSGPDGFYAYEQNPVRTNVTLSMAGTYSLRLHKDGCYSETAEVEVQIGEPLGQPQLSSNSPLCTGGTLLLSTTTVADTYEWSGPNGFTSTLQNPSITNVTTANAGTYRLVVVSGEVQSPPAELSVTVYSLPIPSINGSTQICEEASTTFSSANSYTSYSWRYGGEEIGTEASITVAAAGEYTLTVVDANGCTGSNSVLLNVTPKPATPVITSNSPVLQGRTLNMSASEIPYASYYWTGPNGFTSNSRSISIPAVQASDAGEYAVVATVAGCPGNAATTTVAVLPDADGDGITDAEDNCPNTSNPAQVDTDNDSQGDACDEDDDGDGIPDFEDCDSLSPEIGGLTTWYADTDGDGWGTDTEPEQSCTQPEGYVARNGDCNDGDATINPGATEIAGDNIDQNCDGKDEEVPDADADGVADSVDNCPSVANADQSDLDGDQMGDACDSDMDGDEVPNDEDCAPLNPAIGRAATWYADADKDGYGNASVTTLACTQPEGYVASSSDCNDNDASVYPDAPELCDGKDNNCDGSVDEGIATQVFYADADGDGLGDANSTTISCSQPNGYVSNSNDCDDTNAQIGAATVWYADTDGDSYGNAAAITMACNQPQGYVANSTDCNDGDATVNPGAAEIPNDGVDQDCDGEDATTIQDADGDGLADDADNCPAAYNPDQADRDGDSLGDACDDDMDGDGIANAEDCDPYDPATGSATTWYADTDRDGYGNQKNSLMSCEQPAGYVKNDRDCNDGDSSIYPGATEVPLDGIDQNCDGVDEGTLCGAEKRLTLTPVCSDNPAQRRWMIYNPNDCPVRVLWWMHRTSQKGRLIAPPGESYFTTETITKGVEVGYIQWTNPRGYIKKKARAASKALCSEESKAVADTELSAKAQGTELISELSAYPMPFSDNISLRCEGIRESSKLSIRLYTLDGREFDLTAYSYHQQEGSVELDIQQISLPNAMFILQLRIDDGEPIHVRVLKHGK